MTSFDYAKKGRLMLDVMGYSSIMVSETGYTWGEENIMSLIKTLCILKEHLELADDVILKNGLYTDEYMEKKTESSLKGTEAYNMAFEGNRQ